MQMTHIWSCLHFKHSPGPLDEKCSHAAVRANPMLIKMRKILKACVECKCFGTAFNIQIVFLGVFFNWKMGIAKKTGCSEDKYLKQAWKES